MTDRYWHFCAIAKDGTPVLRDGSLALGPGETETYQGTLKMCNTGLHASKRAMDALSCAPGSWCRLVQLEGEVLHGADKSVATRRLILTSFDARKVLHEFACCIAETALLISDEDGDVYWQAIEAKRAWLRGEIGDKELAAARDAAEDVGGAGAWPASWAASAAWAASWAAAWSTSAYWAAARDEIGDLLESMLTEAAGATTRS